MLHANSSTSNLVEVIPLSGFNKALAYAVPPTCAATLQLGSLVRIPLRGRSELGVVIQVGSRQDIAPGKLKMLYEVVQEYPVLTADLLKLYYWAQKYYATTPEAMLEAMIPTAIRRGMKPKKRLYVAMGQTPTQEQWSVLEKRAPKQVELLRFVQQQICAQARAPLLKRMGISASACEALVKKNYLMLFH